MWHQAPRRPEMAMTIITNHIVEESHGTNYFVEPCERVVKDESQQGAIAIHMTPQSPHRAKEISTILALRTTKYLQAETAYMPWESALDNLDFFYLMFDRSEVLGPMQVCRHNNSFKKGTQNRIGCV